jgi:hypothetical protein
MGGISSDPVYVFADDAAAAAVALADAVDGISAPTMAAATTGQVSTAEGEAAFERGKR